LEAEEHIVTLTTPQRSARHETITPSLHELPATLANVHWGYFDASLAPAIKVRSGDVIRAEAVTHHAGDAPELLMDDAITTLFNGIPEEDRNPGVHIMTGPIHVEGAKAGDVLEVRYLQMTPRFIYGSNLAGRRGVIGSGVQSGSAPDDVAHRHGHRRRDDRHLHSLRERCQAQPAGVAWVVKCGGSHAVQARPARSPSRRASWESHLARPIRQHRITSRIGAIR
jgi:hypothetical protein